MGRYGGEEFIVVMPHTDLTGACFFAERLRREVAAASLASRSAAACRRADGDTPIHSLPGPTPPCTQQTAGRNRPLSQRRAKCNRSRPMYSPVAAT